MAIFGPLYERVMRWSRHRHAEWYLGAMSFAESSFFPIPVDVMLAPMCLAQPQRAWRFALNATVLSVLGGLAGYAIGFLTFEAVEPWLRDSRYWDPYLTARAWFDDYGMWAVFVAGFRRFLTRFLRLLPASPRCRCPDSLSRHWSVAARDSFLLPRSCATQVSASKPD